MPTPTNLRSSLTQDSFLNIWLAYQSSPFGSKPVSYYTIYNFVTWTNPVPITSDRNANTAPTINALSNGTIFLAWVSNRTGNEQVWYKTYTNGVWSLEYQLTSNASPDKAPSAAHDLKGNIWVFYQRVVISNSILYYRVYTPGVGWSSEVQLTTESNPIDILPSATVTFNGWVWVVWSSFRTGSYQTFSKYFNGTVWSPDNHLITYKGDDLSPTILQTGDGTVWVAWSRDIPLSGGSFEADIYYANSTNLGSSWSASTAITNSVSFDDFSPSLIESALNQRLYIFWSSDMPAATDYNIFYEVSLPILIHDLAVTSVGVNQHKLYPGGFKSIGQSGIVLINGTVTNLGNFPELAQTSIYANSTLLSSSSFSLLPSQSQTVYASWNTTKWKPGCYQIIVAVAPVPGEVATSNDMLIGGPVHILPLGDIDQDGSVTFIDASVVALAFQSTPGSPNWNIYADMNFDGVVDFLDVSTMALNYGVTTPPC